MTSRDRRALAIGATIVAVAWLCTRGAPTAIEALAAKEEAAAQRAALLAKTRDRVASLPLIDDSLRVLDEVASEVPEMLLVGADLETAAVDLMSRIRNELAPLRVSVTGFSGPGANEASGPLRLAAIGVAVETDYAGLLDAIRQLDMNPALGIESVEIRAADPHSREGRPEVLTAQLEVSGWYRSEVEEAQQ